MSELEQKIGAALLERLIAKGITRAQMAARMPQAVITNKGAGFLVGYLSWRDDSGETRWGPSIEVTQSRPAGDDLLIAQFAEALAQSVDL